MIVDIMVTITCKFSALIASKNYRDDEEFKDNLELTQPFDEVYNVLVKTE